MAKLTAAERRALPDSDFAIPETRQYPIKDKNHARAALTDVARVGTEAQKIRVRNAVKKRHPSIKIEMGVARD